MSKSLYLSPVAGSFQFAACMLSLSRENEAGDEMRSPSTAKAAAAAALGGISESSCSAGWVTRAFNLSPGDTPDSPSSCRTCSYIPSWALTAAHGDGTSEQARAVLQMEGHGSYRTEWNISDKRPVMVMSIWNLECRSITYLRLRLSLPVSLPRCRLQRAGYVSLPKAWQPFDFEDHCSACNQRSGVRWR
jgi:hypothetical protein